jgi:hypothetical protein
MSLAHDGISFCQVFETGVGMRTSPIEAIEKKHYLILSSRSVFASIRMSMPPHISSDDFAAG